ncbi:hypothetical protein L1887_34295 [Cichorium endivia]|nr:hypothetical protein L1887_34295 [Cichorium endivia]
MSHRLRSDNRTTILFSEFGFSQTGHISFEIPSVSVTSNVSQPDPSRIGFYLLSHESRHNYFLELMRNPDMCVLDNKFISVLFTFQDLDPHSQSIFNKSYSVSYPGVYTLNFANCNNQSLVTMDVRTELYNIDDGTTKDYLSVGLTQLPSLYFTFSLIYLCFLGFWIFVCFKNQQCFQRIHLLMGGLLVITFVHLIYAAADQHYLQVTGIHGWDVLIFIYRFIRTALFLTMIVLISSGWCSWKQFIEGWEKVILLIVIFFQVMAHVILLLSWENGPYNNEHWLYWNGNFLYLDLVCCIAICVHVVWSHMLLEDASETDGKIARNLPTCKLVVLLIIAYLVITRFIVGAVLAKLVLYTCPWVINAAEETVNLVFCMVMFYMFMPYDDEKTAGMGLLDEEYGIRSH